MASTTATSPQPTTSTTLPPASTTLSLLTLPSEILIYILNLLRGHTLKDLRLTCTFLTTLTTPHLFHTLPLLFTQRSFTRLLSLSSLPHLAIHVRVLTYNTMVLNERGTYSDYLQWTNSNTGKGPLYPEPDVGVTFGPGGSSGADDEDGNEQIPVRKQKINYATFRRIYHTRWSSIFDEQQALLKPGVEVAQLENILERLPNLTEVRMQCDAQAFVDYYDCIYNHKINSWVILWSHRRNWLEVERIKFVNGGGEGRRRRALEEALRIVEGDERVMVVVRESVAAPVSVWDKERGWPWF